ncbi:MAG: copper-translocating P-type ATPase, partial [Firmicutes bacterium]|nr:copper-translocating P-type ATPase [Bacillota bacterium]
MKQYNVTGMSCAACSARVEKAVAAVSGVSEVSVSLLTNSMGVEGTASPKEICAAVEAAGYGASLKRREDMNDASALDTGEGALRNRLIASIGFLLVLMYFSMGHMMWGWPIPGALEGKHFAMGLIQMVLAIIIMVINKNFFVSGFKSLAHRAPNMDTLVALGSGASFVWSFYVLFGRILPKGTMEPLYFESAAMILTLITVGKLLEARSKGRTTDALKSLMELAPKTALLLEGGVEREVPIEEIKAGDLFAVRPGGSVPVDGEVVEGATSVDESMLTGESIPVDKEEGGEVFAGTINLQGYIVCRATRVGEDTSLAEIISLVSDAQATKAPIAKTADKVSGIFVPVVMGIALVTMIIWLLAGAGTEQALERAISVLVISCPCALGLATPVAIMVASGMGAKNGILFKTATSLEEAGKTQIVVMDKTGTITEGRPGITDVLPAEGVTEDELLDTAALLEIRSEHPLARAITGRLSEEQAKEMLEADIEGFEVASGHGLRAVSGAGADGQGAEIRGGNAGYIAETAKIPDALLEKTEQLAGEGKTCLFFEKDGKLLGTIAVADTIKQDAAEAIERLKALGIRTVMLTGDNAVTAGAVGRLAGTDEVIAEVLPDGKEKAVALLKETGKVMMVGDGINDAPALVGADIGVAIGAGTDVAIDAAEIVLAGSGLKDIPACIRLSRKALKNIHENLFWAFFYNIIGIPLAAGLWIPVFGWTLGPMFAAAAMSLSSFCVVSNALRLNFYDIYDSSHDRPSKNSLPASSLEKIRSAGEEIRRMTEEQKAARAAGKETGMEKTMKIEGMMCA